MLGNVIALNDPVKMAEEIAMLDCYFRRPHNFRVRAGYRGGELWHAGISPTEKPGPV